MRVINRELSRHKYYDQTAHPADYVSASLTSAVNGDMYGVYVVGTGERLDSQSPLYTSAATEADVRELTFRVANGLARPRMLYCGANCSGVLKRSAEIRVAKNKARYALGYDLRVVRYRAKYGVESKPNDWGRLCVSNKLTKGKTMNNEKPPLGLKPRRSHDAARAVDIAKAVARYIEAGKCVPSEWLDELGELAVSVRPKVDIVRAHRVAAGLESEHRALDLAAGGSAGGGTAVRGSEAHSCTAEGFRITPIDAAIDSALRTSDSGPESLVEVGDLAVAEFEARVKKVFMRLMTWVAPDKRAFEVEQENDKE